jgi:Uma2 family endonuclease
VAQRSPLEDDADALWRLLEAVPPQFRAEIIDGTLHVNPRPSVEHQVANGALTAFIGVPYMYHGDGGGPDGWWILSEPGVRVQVKEEFAPDHAGWRRSKLPFLPSIITTAPDWVCEILSPGKAESYDRDQKAPFYARLGVEWLWLVDVVRRDVEVYQLRSGAFIRIPVALGSEARLPPFEHIALPMDRFWI